MKLDRMYRNGAEGLPEGKPRKTRRNTRPRHAILLILLAAGILFCVQHGRAAVTVLRFADAAAAVDNGPQNGVFDAFIPLLYDRGLVVNNGWTSFRTALEFDVRTLPPGATINFASLTVFLNNGEGTREIALNGYAGDGTVQLTDFALNGFVGAQTVGWGLTALNFDVTSFLSQLQSSGGTFAGFNFREDPANQFNYTVMQLSVAVYYAPELSVDYTEVPEATSLAIFGLGVALLLSWRQGLRMAGPRNGRSFQRAPEADRRTTP